ncbi:MAG: GLPGLI family protein [Flavobacteriales bacterium]|nr:GLPGLI family protein [Flavobacteriales bacterium]
MMTIYSRISLIILMFVLGLGSFEMSAQYKEGMIIYQRKTNLYKRFGERAKDWIKEKDKIKTEFFVLTFTDSLSTWKEQPTDVPDPMSWGTSRHEVYRNLRSPVYYSVRDLWGDKVHVEDTLPQRNWKITDSKRIIAGYNCRKAFWEVNDSVKIYAWYCDEIVPSIGPERFYGLPGAILGLASEDGGVVYFAQEVKFYQPKPEEFEFKRGKKVQTMEKTKEELELAMSRSRWGNPDISYYFIW